MIEQLLHAGELMDMCNRQAYAQACEILRSVLPGIEDRGREVLTERPDLLPLMDASTPLSAIMSAPLAQAGVDPTLVGQAISVALLVFLALLAEADLLREQQVPA
jgi:hypothetical protein